MGSSPKQVLAGSETRYGGFWLGLSPSHMGSSPKQVLAGSES